MRKGTGCELRTTVTKDGPSRVSPACTEPSGAGSHVETGPESNSRAWNGGRAKLSTCAGPAAASVFRLHPEGDSDFGPAPPVSCPPTNAPEPPPPGMGDPVGPASDA